MPRPLFQYRVLRLILACALFTALSHPARGEDFQVSVTIDFGSDLGQHFGSLFEARDENGRVVLGAGFPGVTNTRIRGGRHTLHFFVQPADDDGWKQALEPLPRPGPDAGTYLHEVGGRMYAATRGGATDSKTRRWDPELGQWIVDGEVDRFAIPVGRQLLSFDTRGVRYGGNPVLTLDDGRLLRVGYYAQGIFLGRIWQKESPAINRLVAIPWRADSGNAMAFSRAVSLDLPSAKDFVYACGQLGDHLLMATNTGGVYRFDSRRRNWSVLLEPDYGTSFQIYTMINYHDQLLMGQYPSGELWTYDGGDSIERLPGWPPVLKGVSGSAREAQTAVIYGGQLLVGVWPWGEVWRYDRKKGEWLFFRRLFSQPALTDTVTHPYESEMIALDAPVRNLWGQRVTGLLPIGESLFLSSSAKHALSFEAQYDFLQPDRWKEYGAVYRFQLPGQLAVPIRWNDAPTNFEFVASDGRVTIIQDGQVLGSTALPGDFGNRGPLEFTRGTGVHGETSGGISKFEVR